MSYNIIRKVLIVIGDENFTGKSVRPLTENVSSDYIKENRNIYCNTWDENEGKFKELSKKNEYSILEPLFYNLKDNGFFIVYIKLNELNDGSFLDFDAISERLIGTNPYYDGIISRVKKYLSEYKKDQNIVEIPEISAIIYNGTIRNAKKDEVVSSYGSNIMTFISNLNLFLPTIGLNNSFVFIDVINNFLCSRTIFSDNKELVFKNLSKLRSTQRKLDENNDNLWNKYHAIETQDIKPNYICDSSFEIKIDEESYENPTGYYDLAGVFHKTEGLTGFIYGPEEISKLGSKISDILYDDILKFDIGLNGLSLVYYNYRGSFDNAYLFKKGKGALTLNDFVGFDPEYVLSEDSSEEEVSQYNNFKEYKGEVVFKLDKYSESIFRGTLNKKDTFTHLLFYNNINNTKTFVAIVYFFSPQEINSGEKIKIKIRKEVGDIEYSKYIKYQNTDTNYTHHSETIGYDFDNPLETELGLLSSKEANNNAKIEEVSLVENATKFDDRSNRITTNKLLSGDSLFLVDGGYYRDRDNSLYSPYILLPDVVLDKYTKINFDAKLGLYFWNINKDSREINLFLTTGRKNKKKISFPLLVDNNEFLTCYENLLDKVRISYACGDLIVNFNGKVYKIQKTGDDYTCAQIYKDLNGCIIFPAWYDLWNIAYIVRDNNVCFLDCSGGELPLTSYETLEDHAYVENFPGPKNIDYKNIISTYLMGGVVLKELILQGLNPFNISIYDSAIISDTNKYKIDIYPLSYKYPEKTSLFKIGHNGEQLLEDLFLSNEGIGVKFKTEDFWYFSSFFHDLNTEVINFNSSHFDIYNPEKRWCYKNQITNSNNKIRIVNSRGVRVAFTENTNTLI